MRWGVLGTANIARRRFVPGVRQSAEGGEVVAVASRDEARAREFAKELDIPIALGSYEALLERDDVDAIYVTLPNSLHAPWAERAARAGKHVLCEKPLAATAAEAERAAAAARESGVVLAEGFMYRLLPQYARVRALLDEGAVGPEATILRATFTFHLTPERRAAGDVRALSNMAGGALMDIGCYTLNVARLVFGTEPVEASARRWLDPDYGVDTQFAAAVIFPGGRLAALDCSFEVAYRQHLEIGGQHGTLILEQPFNPMSQPAVLRLVRGPDVLLEEQIPSTDAFVYQADAFARSVRAGRLLPPMEDGVAQARAIEMLARAASASAGTTVSAL